MNRLGLIATCLFTASAPFVPADAADQTASAASLQFFETKVRPVLVKHCYECHSAQSGAAEGDLRVDTRRAIRLGGARGPAVVPGKPQDSWLIKAITHGDPDLKMPPKQAALPDPIVADLKSWIKLGAADPREAKSGISQADRSHWSYQPLSAPAVPAVKNVDWPLSSIDRFVLARLESHGMSPSADAEVSRFLRRLHFDLAGLPPSPGAITSFQKRVSDVGLTAALADEVDSLLASPRFGEKWARHWLDVARFGESSGGEANISFPYAWRYRDYIIDCFNADVPFDRFLTEQIAGDLLPCANQTERVRLLVATGFLAVGPKNLDEANPRQFQADLVDEQIDAVTRAVMATSLACARCHDHKFDPFSMRDYYALAGIFSSTKTFFGTAVSPANRVGGDPLLLPASADVKILHRSIPARKVAALRSELAALQQEKKDGMAAAFKARAEGQDASNIFTLRDALRIFWRSGAIEGQLEKVDDQGRALPLAMGTLDDESIGDARLLERGEVAKPKAPVPRGMPDLLENTIAFAISDRQSGRLQLARWLTHPAHPLTARVLVNRVWHYLFGAGLVRSVDNFGATGDRPSHPELLDFLATSFVEQGWSIKQLIREIVLSRSYRQTSAFAAAAFERDPDNRWLWRVSKRRLDAEAIRDAMLVASGELQTTRPEASLVGRVIGDRPISLIGLDRRVPSDLDGSLHRSVYLPVIRDRLPDALELFDFAETSLVTGHRETTNVPVQALYLMNSPFVQQRSQALAARLKRECPTPTSRIDRAFLLCFGRAPDADERSKSLRYLQFVAVGRDSDVADVAVADRRLASFCQALLCTAEFRNLD